MTRDEKAKAVFDALTVTGYTAEYCEVCTYRDGNGKIFTEWALYYNEPESYLERCTVCRVFWHNNVNSIGYCWTDNGQAAALDGPIDMKAFNDADPNR